MQRSATSRVDGYSPWQVALHWTVVVLVAFQFLAHEGIEEAWRASRRGEPAPAAAATLEYLHVAAGVLILLLMLVRVWLRLSRGAPPPPADEPRLLQLASEAVHASIYLLLFLLALSGALAWLAGVAMAGEAHELLTSLLLAAIVLHVAGALFQHFVRRSQVMMRMLRPQRR